MGLSGIVLKKKDNVNIEEIIRDIKQSAINAGIQFKMGKEAEINVTVSSFFVTPVYSFRPYAAHRAA